MEELRVFIVEDDPMVLSINKRFTERIPGFKVVGAAAGQAEAVRLVEETRPHLVLLDIYLPEGNGLEALRALRNLGFGVDVIFITAAQDPRTISEALRNGAVDYLIKPFEFERFQEALLNYTRLHAKLDSGRPLQQSDVDSLRKGEIKINPSAKGGLAEVAMLTPKGIDETTLGYVFGLLNRQQQPMSADEVADDLGLSRVTARRYLEYLSETGKVSVMHFYGSVGRPQKRYRIKDAGF
ncbi:MAG: response regulator [Firmicutes bacterium]|nr:response regulator [Bacillota bacterium]